MTNTAITSPKPAPGLALGLGLVLLLALVWGTNWPVMKIALAEVDVWSFRAACAAGGGLLLMAMLKLAGQRLTVSAAERMPLVAASLLNVTAFHLLIGVGLQYFPAGPSAIIAYTMPVWATLLGRIVLKERLTGRRIAALGLGLAGLAVLMGPRIVAAGGIPIGAVPVMAAAMLWGAATVVQKHTRWIMPTTVLTAWQLVIGGLPILLGAVFFSDLGALAGISTRAAVAWSYTVLLGVMLGHYLWFRLVAMFPVSITGICSLAVPVVGVFSSALLIGEAVGPAELGALALVTAAIGLALFEPRRR